MFIDRVLGQPVDDARCRIGSACGGALRKKVVSFVGVEHQFARVVPTAYEGDEQFFGLAFGAALILLALQEQGGRRRVADVLQRRQASRLLAVEAGGGGHEEGISVVTPIGCPIVCFDVPHGGHDDGGLEEFGVADGPGGEVAAVRFAADGQAVVADTLGLQ